MSLCLSSVETIISFQLTVAGHLPWNTFPEPHLVSQFGMWCLGKQFDFGTFTKHYSAGVKILVLYWLGRRILRRIIICVWILGWRARRQDKRTNHSLWQSRMQQGENKSPRFEERCSYYFEKWLVLKNSDVRTAVPRENNTPWIHISHTR